MDVPQQPDTGWRLAAALRLTMDFWSAGGGDARQLLAAHPDLRDLLEGLLSDPDLPGRDVAAVGSPTSARPLPRVTGYAVERELGRGGMGVVYAALQRSLGRRVALKLLSNPMLAHERALWRFRREAQLLARLEHPGIVRVLDAGVEDGVPYFAMEYVAGAPLSAVLDAVQRHGLATATAATVVAAVAGASDEQDESSAVPARAAHTYVDLVLDLVAQVADALAFAHAAGVVHRDVKPSNVLLRPDGRAVLSDFGIARLEGGPTMTVTGDFTGTPFYVSPEQARHAAADHRSDLFSLGVLLFEALTLQRPFPGEDTAAVLDAIQKQEPTDPRRLNSAVTADVAAVLGKALAKDPADRYQGGGALAADLRAAQRGLPVTARRPGPWRRLRRWARLEPWRAAAAAIVVFASLALVGVVAAFTSSLVTEAQRTTAALVDAQRARVAAEANLDDAMAAVDEMLSQAGDQDIAAVPQLVQVRQQMLQRALAFYSRFTAREDDDPRVRLRAAIAQERVARARRLLGDTEAAVALGTSAVRALTALQATAPGDAGLANALGVAQLNLGAALVDRGRVDEARGLLQAAETTFTAISGQGEVDLVRRFGLIQTLHARLQLESLRSPTVAEKVGAQAVAEIELLRRDDPADPRYGPFAAVLRSEFAALLRRLGKVDAAEEHLLVAIREAEELGRLDAARYDVRRLDCTVYEQLAYLYKSTGRLQQAESAGTAAVERWRALVAQFPQVPNSRALCLRSVIALANIERYLGKFDAAASLAEDALHAGEGLVAEFPDNPEYHADHASAVYNLGSIRLRHFDDAAAREGTELLQQSRSLWQELRAKDPENADYAVFMAHTLNELGYACEGSASWEESAAVYAQAAQVYADLIGLQPQAPEYHDARANALRGRARAELLGGDAASAAKTVAEALSILRRGLEQDARQPARRRFARLALEVQAHVCRALGDEGGVVAAADELAPLVDEPEDADELLGMLTDGAAAEPLAGSRTDAAVGLLRRVCAVDKGGASARLDEARFAGLRGNAGYEALRRAVRD
ncbi:MAG: serine/threonine-protein kinase [Planctomycetota bacterium]